MGRPSARPLIVAALQESRPRGMSQVEIMAATGLSAPAVHKHIHQLHQAGEVHVASWNTKPKKGGVYQARYRLGAGKDRAKPAAQTREAMDRRYRERIKRAQGLAEVRAMKAESQRRSYWRKKTRPRRDPFIAALFGAANDTQERTAA